MVYVMTGELSRNPAAPSPYYYAGIVDGLCQNGMPVEPLEQAHRNLMDELRFHVSRNAQQYAPLAKKHPRQER